MARKTQLALSTEAWSKIEKIVLEANEGFENGSITNSDVANELILNGSADIKKLQKKHINVSKTLRSFASRKDLSLDEVIDHLVQLKNGGAASKKKIKRSEVNECVKE